MWLMIRDIASGGDKGLSERNCKLFMENIIFSGKSNPKLLFSM